MSLFTLGFKRRSPRNREDYCSTNIVEQCDEIQVTTMVASPGKTVFELLPQMITRAVKKQSNIN